MSRVKTRVAAAGLPPARAHCTGRETDTRFRSSTHTRWPLAPPAGFDGRRPSRTIEPAATAWSRVLPGRLRVQVASTAAATRKVDARSCSTCSFQAADEWRPTGQPVPVRIHDFLIPERGKAIPYGSTISPAMPGGSAWASTMTRTIGRWWRKMGRPRYRRARSLLITADAGGSNGTRVRRWKWELQRLANRTRDRKSTRLNSSHIQKSRMPSSA